MLLVVGTFRLLGQSQDDARAAMVRMVTASRAEAGCLDYCYAEDIEEPDLIHIRELWRDQHALDEHFATDHSQRWQEFWFSPQIGDRKLEIYTVGEPRRI